MKKKFSGKKIRKKVRKYLTGFIGEKNPPLMQEINVERQKAFTSMRVCIALKKIDLDSAYFTERAFYYLLDGQLDFAVDSFKQSLDCLKIPQFAKEIWARSFEMLAHFLLRGVLLPDSGFPEIKLDSPLKKILVSGMGWSGSGALHDYFKEFHNVHAVGGEMNFIARGASIQKIESSFGKKNFHEILRNFFKYTIYSQALPKTFTEAKAVRNNIFINADSDGKYALACYHFLRSIITDEIEGIRNTDNYCDNASLFIDTALGVVSEDNKIVLLDNFITIPNIRSVKYLKDYIIFCFFRDPRSNFAARCYEDLQFHREVDTYISNYRKKRIDFENKLSDNKLDKSHLRCVQFEEFILSAELRNSLAIDAGLDISARTEFMYLKPWESERNIDIYRNFKDQDAIRKIEKALPEYLWKS